MSVSNTFKEVAFAQETDSVVIVLITLNGDSLVEPIRISSVPYERLTEVGTDVYGCISNEETFIFLPYEIELPRDDRTGTVSAKLKIENIDRQIVPYARGTIKSLNVNIKVVLSDDVDFVELEFDDFELTNVSYNTFTIEGDLTLDYWSLEPYPSHRFTPSSFAGLF